VPDLFYVAAYGPMHLHGVWTAYLEAQDEAEVRRLAGELAPKGYDLERVLLMKEAPVPLLRDCLILNSALTVGQWWDVRSREIKPAIPNSAGQARLF
jgi:hypothetical protein